ncbi:MAG: mntB1 [Thermoleophilia bacterium]|nr:mntB1 [Thermoleophilia bacterium]
MSDGAWITIVAGLVASSCALLGSFLLVRRQALLSDAVSHAVLPGIVMAWLVVGNRDPIPMILGATLFAVICVVLVELLEGTGLVRTDGAIGLVFPTLFSLGVLGVDRWTRNLHLDLDSTIYGEIAFIPLTRSLVLGIDMPSAVVSAALVFLADLLLVTVAWRALSVSSFDSGFATSVGVPARLLARVLLVAVAATAVIAFESVGAILVVTLFIVPAAAALVLARRMFSLVLLAVTAGWITAIVGWNGARELDASIAGMMGVTAGALFALAVAAPALRRRFHSAGR